MKTSVDSIKIFRFDDCLDDYVEKQAFIREPKRDAEGFVIYENGLPVFSEESDLRRKMLLNYASEAIIAEDSIPVQLLFDIQDGFLKEFTAAPKLVRQIMLVSYPQLARMLFLVNPEELVAPKRGSDDTPRLANDGPKRRFIDFMLKLHEIFRKVRKLVSESYEPLFDEIARLTGNLEFVQKEAFGMEDDLR